MSNRNNGLFRYFVSKRGFQFVDFKFWFDCVIQYRAVLTSKDCSTTFVPLPVNVETVTVENLDQKRI